MKICRVCKIIKGSAEFGYRSRTKDNLHSVCKPCARIQARDHHKNNLVRRHAVQNTWRRNNPDKIREIGWRKKGINIELPEYNERFLNQFGKCAICQRPQTDFTRAFSPDHDHKTGKIRGLLCGNCNTGIGQFKDDPVLLENAIQYLRMNYVA